MPPWGSNGCQVGVIGSRVARDGSFDTALFVAYPPDNIQASGTEGSSVLFIVVFTLQYKFFIFFHFCLLYSTNWILRTINDSSGIRAFTICCSLTLVHQA